MNEPQTAAEVPFNNGALLADAFSGVLTVQGAGGTQPPGLPAGATSYHGILYVTGTSTVNAWEGHDEEFALGVNDGWVFVPWFPCIYWNVGLSDWYRIDHNDNISAWTP